MVKCTECGFDDICVTYRRHVHLCSKCKVEFLVNPGS